MTSPATVLVASLIWISTTIGQDKPAPQPFDLDEAYQVYNVLVPKQESYSFAKGSLVIQQETVPQSENFGKCLTAEAAQKFQAALADFVVVNSKAWLLQAQFHLDKPYQLIGAKAIKEYFKEQGPGGWSGFYREHPDSGGFMTLSAVGFDKTKTLAVVHAGSSCGALCGSRALHLFERVDGEWKESRGVTCATLS